MKKCAKVYVLPSLLCYHAFSYTQSAKGRNEAGVVVIFRQQMRGLFLDPCACMPKTECVSSEQQKNHSNPLVNP